MSLYQNKSINNFSNSSTALASVEYCRRFEDEENFIANYVTTLASIILNILSCPLIILLNLLSYLGHKKKT